MIVVDIKTRIKKRKILRKRITILELAVLILVTAVLSIYTYASKRPPDSQDINKPLDLTLDGFTSVPVVPEVEEEMEGIVNIALFGLDKRGDEISRTDTIMIVSLDGSSKKLKLVSLMRDIYVDIPGKCKDRINAAYAYGGPGLGIDTINKNFGMDIKYYVSVDFKGVYKLISKLGGVDIDIQEGEIPDLNECLDEVNCLDPENIEPHITLPGMQHLMGKQALSYTRIRYFGNGDYERTERQRKVAVQLFEKVKKMGILKFPELIASTLPYVETNIPVTEMISLGASTFKFKNDIEQYRLPVDGAFYEQYIRGMAVLVPDIEENTRMLHEFIYGHNKTVPSTP